MKTTYQKNHNPKGEWVKASLRKDNTDDIVIAVVATFEIRRLRWRIPLQVGNWKN